MIVGIKPTDGKFHTMGQMKDAITKSVGYAPFIECNVDSSGYHQLYQVYQCVDASASNFIECPVFPHGRPCGNKVEFPSFSSASSHDELWNSSNFIDSYIGFYWFRNKWDNWFLYISVAIISKARECKCVIVYPTSTK